MRPTDHLADVILRGNFGGLWHTILTANQWRAARRRLNAYVMTTLPDGRTRILSRDRPGAGEELPVAWTTARNILETMLTDAIVVLGGDWAKYRQDLEAIRNEIRDRPV